MRKILFLMLLVASSARSEDPKPTTTVIPLTVSPAPAPVPALKYMFSPPLEEIIPGNPVLGYLKCFMEQDNMFARKEVIDDREKLINLNFEEFRTAKSAFTGELRNYGGGVVRNARRATRMNVLDWNIVQEMQENGYETLLPEIQKLRSLTQVVTLQTRGEIAAGDFDSAVKDITVQLMLARHLGEHPTYIGTLVGIAIARIGMQRVTEFIQEPKSPNLYWALSNLPQPLVRQEQAILGELAMFNGKIGGMKNITAPEKIWGKPEIAQARELVGVTSWSFEASQKKKMEIEKWLLDRLNDKDWMAKAKAALVSPTRTAQMIEKYPGEQVLFLIILAKAEIRLQETLKFANLPYAQVAEYLKSSTPNDAMPPEEYVTYILGGMTNKARLARIRLEQQIALLRGVEALRIYAAANDGKLPADLKSIGLPVPIDPVTGAPIQYTLKDNQASLRGTTIAGYEKFPEWNYVYEVKIRK